MRNRNSNDTPATNNAVASMGLDWSSLMNSEITPEEMMEQMNKAKEQAQRSMKREQALSENGIIHVRINKNMPLKQSQKTGRWYCLGTGNGLEGEGVKVATKSFPKGQVATDNLKSSLAVLEVDLGFTSECVRSVERVKENGNFVYELQLAGPVEVTKLQQRFEPGHVNQGENVYLLDPEKSPLDPQNWTADENEFPLMKRQLRVMASALIAYEIAVNNTDLTDDLAELEKEMGYEAKISKGLQLRGLNAALERRRREAATVTAKSDSMND